MPLSSDPDEVIAAIETERDRICSLPMLKITPTPRDPKEKGFAWPTAPRAGASHREDFVIWGRDFVTKYDIAPQAPAES